MVEGVKAMPKIVTLCRRMSSADSWAADSTLQQLVLDSENTHFILNW